MRAVPWFAGMMAILMFSLAGVPPFIGFWAKLGVVQAVLGVDYTWLAVVAVLFSVVGAFFYLRIVKLMYFDEPTDDDGDRRLDADADGAERQCAAGVRLGCDSRQPAALCQRALHVGRAV